MDESQDNYAKLKKPDQKKKKKSILYDSICMKF